MIKSFPAFCMLCAIFSPVSAQSFVTMYDGDIYFSESSLTRLSMAQSEDLFAGMSAKFLLRAGVAGNGGAPDQNNLAFAHQAQLGLSGNWGTLALGRSSNPQLHDLYVQDQMTVAAIRNSSDSLMALDIPAAHHTLFASYSDQNDQTGSMGTTIVKQITLAYTYPISRMTNLFIARTRLDNFSNNQAPPSGFAALGCRQLQLGVHHSF